MPSVALSETGIGFCAEPGMPNGGTAATEGKLSRIARVRAAVAGPVRLRGGCFPLLSTSTPSSSSASDTVEQRAATASLTTRIEGSQQASTLLASLILLATSPAFQRPVSGSTGLAMAGGTTVDDCRCVS